MWHTCVNGLLPLAYTSAALTTAKEELESVISAMNKYIAAGGIGKLYELYRQGNDEFHRYILFNIFSAEERAYIDNLIANVPIVLGTDTYPVSFYNAVEGEFQGISVDILNEISNMTGIGFEPVNNKDASWGEILEILRTGEAALISDSIIDKTLAYVNTEMIANELYISEETVRVHVRNLLKKLGIEKRTDLSEWLKRRL